MFRALWTLSAIRRWSSLASWDQFLRSEVDAGVNRIHQCYRMNSSVHGHPLPLSRTSSFVIWFLCASSLNLSQEEYYGEAFLRICLNLA